MLMPNPYVSVYIKGTVPGALCPGSSADLPFRKTSYSHRRSWSASSVIKTSVPLSYQNYKQLPWKPNMWLYKLEIHYPSICFSPVTPVRPILNAFLSMTHYLLKLWTMFTRAAAIALCVRQALDVSECASPSLCPQAKVTWIRGRVQ